MMMNRNLALLSAIVYGTVLAAFGFVVAGYGHGTYLLMGLAGAPLSLLGPLEAMLASLLQWPLVVAAKIRVPKFARGFVLVHYATALLLLTVPSSPYADWNYAANIPHKYRAILVAGMVWYVTGQVVLRKISFRPQPK